MTTIEQLPLTPKQQQFCDEYLKDFNATRAALAAGYSKSTALNGQLMAMPKIAAYIGSRRQEAEQEGVLNYQVLLEELAKIAFCNMGDYFDKYGNVKPIDELCDDERAAIQSITVTERNDGSRSTTIKLHNKLAAIEKIARHMQFYKAPQSVPETKYVYLDKYDVSEQDRFEDDSLDPVEKPLSPEENYYEEHQKLDKWQDELVDLKMSLDDREKLLAKREAEFRQKGGDLTPVPQVENCYYD